MSYRLCLLITTTVFLTIKGFSQNTFVPDDNFEQVLIDLGYDTGPLDNFVPTANINTIIDLDISLLGIEDLIGIEDFTALEILDCSENKLTALDISQNTNLKQLFCSFNKITNLDVSKNRDLNILWCNFNRISILDVSKNVVLLSLICSNNLLTEINVTNNPSLNTFICIGNQISDFDVSLNSQLKIFQCGNNKLTKIDVTNNPILNIFNCEYNTISSLNLTQNKQLEQLFCLGNTLTALDISKNVQLNILSCGRNQLNELDVSKNPELTELSCETNNLTSINLTKNRLLTKVDCSDNFICQFNLQNGTNQDILYFDARGNLGLYCVFVDDVNYSSANWTNIEPITHFVTNDNECDAVENAIPDVDVLEDFYGSTYVLPTLTNGNYFTAKNGIGQQLFPGETITITQTIYIYNTNGCHSNESNFTVIISSNEGVNFFIPKYFTPNNDGEHDYWQVIDSFKEVNTISIYDRQGKLIKYMLPNSIGWDGTYKGYLLPNDSYWYEIVLNNREIVRGYFALKR